VLKRLFSSIFRPAEHELAIVRLYEQACEQARSRVFYTGLGVADEIDARFELYTLHVLLLVMRLRDEGTTEGLEASQSLFDTYVSALDNTLRELGVGDLSIAKKMRKLGESLFGRMKAYEPLIRSQSEALAPALGRNVYGDEAASHAPVLADYVHRTRAHLAAQDIRELLQARVAWPEVLT
jgi:cytochrome b pre-mRNA-processing protein 3